MSSPVQRVVDRDLMPDHNIARIDFVDDFDEEAQLVIGDDIGDMSLPVHFGRVHVALHPQVALPTITVEVWEAEPPSSEHDDARIAWAGRYEGRIDTRFRVGTLATVVGGGSAVTVTATSDRSNVRVHVSDRGAAYERERAHHRADPAGTQAMPTDLEFWLVQIWPV